MKLQLRVKKSTIDERRLTNLKLENERIVQFEYEFLIYFCRNLV
jgi:hypothetical protein